MRPNPQTGAPPSKRKGRVCAACQACSGAQWALRTWWLPAALAAGSLRVHQKGIFFLLPSVVAILLLVPVGILLVRPLLLAPNPAPALAALALAL